MVANILERTMENLKKLPNTFTTMQMVRLVKAPEENVENALATIEAMKMLKKENGKWRKNEL